MLLLHLETVFTCPMKLFCYNIVQFFSFFSVRAPTIYWCSPHSQQKSLKCTTWVQSQK